MKLIAAEPTAEDVEKHTRHRESLMQKLAHALKTTSVDLNLDEVSSIEGETTAQLSHARSSLERDLNAAGRRLHKGRGGEGA